MLYLKRGIKLTVFLVGLFILLVVISYIFIPKDNISGLGMDEVASSGILGERKDSIDIVVVGDSETYSSIIPMQIWKEKGYTSYVCGTSAQKLDCSIRMLEQAFDKQNPKVVILETNSIYRKMKVENKNFAKLQKFLPIFMHHNRWKSIKLSDIGKKVHYTRKDDYKGYRYNVEVKASKKKNHMIPTDEVEKIDKINVDSVKEIKRLCDENGATLLLLSTPSTLNWNYERHNTIVELAKEIKCEYIDMNVINDKIKIDWKKDTRDKGDHMNFFGAVKVTQFLSEYLSETSIIDDHREDPSYKEWQEALIRFEEQTQMY